MEKFAVVMLGAIFITLIVSSFQSLAAQNENDVMSSQYKIHLQVIVRDANEQLVSVIESTNTKIFTTYLPDGKLVEGFIDYMLDKELQNNHARVSKRMESLKSAGTPTCRALWMLQLVEL